MPLYDDSDMKIVPDDPSEVFDTGEGAAYAFARETSNGNMEKARKIGRAFAEQIQAGPDGVVYFGVGEYDTDCTIAQRQTLYAFIVNRVIEDMAPNSIVAQSALSSFYAAVHKVLPEVCTLLSDSAAFTQYILAARSHPEDTCAAGKVFARLCGHPGDTLFEQYGCELSEYFTLHCTQTVLAADLLR